MGRRRVKQGKKNGGEKGGGGNGEGERRVRTFQEWRREEEKKK